MIVGWLNEKMKVAGFTIARNLVQADYPLKEALLSVLPLCDDMVIAVGNSVDGTKAYIEAMQEPKIRLFDTVWDDNKREGGAVLADETNKALDQVPIDADWLVYIQADECLHERYLPVVKAAMEKYLNDAEVDALLFDYLHFYGNYSMVGDSRRWYRQEIRIIKNNRNISSWKDAQGFRTRDGKKLKVAKIDAFIATNHKSFIFYSQFFTVYPIVRLSFEKFHGCNTFTFFIDILLVIYLRISDPIKN